MATVPGNRTGAQSQVDIGHEGFLRHARYRWLKIAAFGSILVAAVYIVADVRPYAYGGSWYGYTTGTIGALLIVWLSLLGIRKRAITPGKWSLKAWTSAHVYLGLALVMVATLHSGFQFGWNVHTLAYALMMLVILSGVFGIVVYSMLPAALSNNREQLTQTQMVEGIRAIDRQLNEVAQPLQRAEADLILAALSEDPFAVGSAARLSGRYPMCATQLAITALHATGARAEADPALGKAEALLLRRKAHLDRLRRHLRLKGILEVWLAVHIPATFALLAALTVHIVSVFYYW